MDTKTKYLLGLGGFRRAVRALSDAAAGLQNASHEHDPQGKAPDDPIALTILDECAKELRAVADLIPGVRQLVRAVMFGDTDCPTCGRPCPTCAARKDAPDGMA